MHRLAIAPLVVVASVAGVAACGGTRATREAATVTSPVVPVAAMEHDATHDTTRVRRGYAAADVRFMHHMLMHHGQALVLTALVPSRTTRGDIKLVAERITVSQRDEMAQMQRWLRARGEPVPAEMDHAHHAGMSGMAGGMAGGDGAHGMVMPGMVTPAEIARLEASSGAPFDSLFVAGMIRHHEGALTMVKDYLATPGAAQESEIFRFASDIDADQRAEIRRLRGLIQP